MTLAKEIRLLDLKCSNGFFEQFKKYSIMLRVTAEEAIRVACYAADECATRLPVKRKGYTPDDIPNRYETE